MKEALKNLVFILVVIGAAFLITRFVAMRAVVDGSSMEPTLYHKESLILDKIHYRFHEPDRFDIVVIVGISDDDQAKKPYFIKRIIGLPGETVQIKDGSVCINGEVLSQDHYARDKITENAGMFEEPYTLDEGEYLVLGDNRQHSRDSRDPLLGPVPRDNIIGTTSIRIWPPSRWGKVE